MRPWLVALAQVLAIAALPFVSMCAGAFLIFDVSAPRLVEVLLGAGSIAAAVVLEVFCIAYANRRWP